MKLLHAADIHLDSPLKGLDRYEGAPVEQFRSATRRALENLVASCLAEAVDFLLIVGDLYDGSWKDYRTGLFFAAQMSRLRAAGIPVFLIRGNHDAESNITRSLRLPENVYEFSSERPETKRIEALGVALHGQSFAKRDVTDDLAARYPDGVPGAFNIGLLHTCASGREGHDSYAPCSLETLRSKGYDYWALGHVHQREVLSESPWIVFPGNLQGRHAKETGAKGASLVTVENGQVVRVEPRPYDVVRWAVWEIDLSSAPAPDQAIELVREQLVRGMAEADGRLLAARLVLVGATAAHSALVGDPDKWSSEIRLAANDVGSERLWIEKIELETRAAIDFTSLAERDDAIGQLVQSLADLRKDRSALEALMSEVVADLKPKLLPELREGADGVRLDDPQFLAALLDDVEQLLVPRLLEKERLP